MTFTIRRHRAALLAVGTAAAAVLAVGGIALATASPGDAGHTAASQVLGHDWKLVAGQTISREQAIDAARQAVPGATVEDTDLDDDRGTTVWEVDVRDAQGVESEVHVDANSGKVLSVEPDDD
ncbi:PepSY domain-containing protein [Nocardia iowensis]|uniref:PepSY domain-containing protein n=1 Tax=Nocardia iowensis TaxID=204891 RepID=A0ABX8S3B0_NOCIO|nr:PepSY domain-containing protein [Nocardia iowensis]QXN94381.1 PepSY domain-containing protein [Nocardia iowensis]